MDAKFEKRIAVMRLSSLGDIVHAIPTVAQIKKSFPGWHLSWIVEPAGAELLRCFSVTDRIIVLNLKKGSVLAKIKHLIDFLGQYAGDFDYIFDFQGLIKSSLIGFLLKGFTIGFHRKNLKEPLARFFYRFHPDYFSEAEHVIYKNRHLWTSFLKNVLKTDIKLPGLAYPLADLTPSAQLQQFVSTHQLEKKHYIIINVGGGWPTKMLSKSQWIEFIRLTGGRYRMVLIWGNDRERKIAGSIGRQTGSIISIFLNFSDLILFIKDAALIVTGDTLALHLADATRTPSVGFFGPTSPFRNGSLLETSLSVYKKRDYGWCYQKKCDTIDCMKAINVHDILKAINRIYETIY